MTPHSSPAARPRAVCSTTSRARLKGSGPSRCTRCFERFTMDKLHRIKAFPILLTVMSYSRNVRMMNLRGRAGFAQESRTSSGIFRQLSTDDFEGDRRIENSVASTIRHRHCPGAEYDRVAVRIYFDFEVSITQRTESDFIAFTASLDFVVLGEKAKANQATNTFAVRAGMRNRLAAGCANSCANSLLQEPRRSCGQNPVNVMQLVIDVLRIGNRARHFGPQGVSIRLAQSRKPDTEIFNRCAQSVSPLPADSAASLFHRRRTALAHRPIPVCLRQQISRARFSTRASQCWRPTRHRRSSRRSNETSPASPLQLRSVVHQTTRICCAPPRLIARMRSRCFSKKFCNEPSRNVRSRPFSRSARLNVFCWSKCSKKPWTMILRVRRRIAAATNECVERRPVRFAKSGERFPRRFVRLRPRPPAKRPSNASSGMAHRPLATSLESVS